MEQIGPNILVFLTDQQRWDTAGCYGNEMQLTPNLDAMAGKGVRFRHSFTCQPVCGPARASLQTGLYAAATGVWHNGLALGTDHVTLAKLFNQAGYRTGYIGKWHLSGTNDEPVPEPLRGGYRYWLAADVPEFTSHPYEGIYYDNDNNPVRFEGYRTDFLTERAVDFIRRQADEPFFLFVSYLEPHQQNDWNRLVAPDGYAERYRDCYVPGDLAASESKGDWKEQLPDYYGMCARLDECLGKLLTTLAETGRAENTIVLFTSDHGCHFRTRNDEYKRSCHEASIRTPMVFSGPGFRGGATIDQLVSLVDVPATLLSAAGLEVPRHMHGRDMMPLVGGSAEDWQNEVFLQISESQVGRAIRTERWKYSAVIPDKEGLQVSAGELYVDDYLYDLEADPYEQENLIGREQYRPILEKLRQRLKKRIVEAGETEPTIKPAV